MTKVKDNGKMKDKGKRARQGNNPTIDPEDRLGIPIFYEVKYIRAIKGCQGWGVEVSHRVRKRQQNE
jgi:hypothetical protein